MFDVLFEFIPGVSVGFELVNEDSVQGAIVDIVILRLIFLRPTVSKK